jgi:hypothetical protein
VTRGASARHDVAQLIKADEAREKSAGHDAQTKADP